VKVASLPKAATNPSLAKVGNNLTATEANRGVITAASVAATAATVDHAETAVAAAGGDNPQPNQFTGEPATARLFY